MELDFFRVHCHHFVRYKIHSGLSTVEENTKPVKAIYHLFVLAWILYPIFYFILAFAALFRINEMEG